MKRIYINITYSITHRSWTQETLWVGLNVQYFKKLLGGNVERDTEAYRIIRIPNKRISYIP